MHFQFGNQDNYVSEKITNINYLSPLQLGVDPGRKALQT